MKKSTPVSLLQASVIEPQSSSKEQRDKMANEAAEEEDLSKEVAVFLDKNVGVEKETTSKIYSLLQDALMKKKCLETEVCLPQQFAKVGSRRKLISSCFGF